MACANGEIMEGALTLWLPEQWSQFEKHRHPFQVVCPCCLIAHVLYETKTITSDQLAEINDALIGSQKSFNKCVLSEF